MKLDDRMKKYEKEFTGLRFRPGSRPIIARLDGRHFHTYCKGMDKPFDYIMIEIMRLVTEALVEETNADVGYCQSDEITLVWINDNPDKEIYFGGRLHKMISSLASFTSVNFNHYAPETWPLNAMFDCRVWNVPTTVEASNALLWREEDAERNSISMLAQHHFSHKQLHKVSTMEMLNMLSAIGVEWSELANIAKHGTHFKRVETSEKFTSDELDELPEKHNARLNPDLEVVRHYVEPFHVTERLSTDERIKLLFGEDRIDVE